VHLETSTRLDSPARASPASEKVLVFDAMRALRREGHPEQAAKLLNDYLRRYPQGSLAEEALALSIEAFTALGDPKAKSLADRYLALYPAGRFRAAAERARARFTQ
jgi:outer membrane protein assembly factor BamD (BamD/ComL family)